MSKTILSKLEFVWPDTIHTIYIDTNVTPIRWIVAWKDGDAFSVTASVIKELPFEVGAGKVNNKRIILKPEKGNRVWRLELQKKKTSAKSPASAKSQ